MLAKSLGVSCVGNVTPFAFCPKIICEIPLDKLLRVRYILLTQLLTLFWGATMDYKTYSVAGDILLFVVGVLFVVGMGFLVVDLLSAYVALNSPR